MKRFFHKRVLTPFAAVLLAVVCIAGTAAVCLFSPQPAQTDEQLYRAAVLDSMTIEDGEVLPLVTITPESDKVTWRDGKVLMITINRHPERYRAGKSLALPGEVWTFTDREMTAWFAAHKTGVKDWTRRLKQLVGVPPDGVYTHVTAMWVLPEDIWRPAYSNNITSPTMPVTLPENIDEAYTTWFNNNIIWSYFTSAYPWTRLGYTYDWAENSGEYGLTEFLIRPGAKVDVVYTESIAAFISRLEQGE